MFERAARHLGTDVTAEHCDFVHGQVRRSQSPQSAQSSQRNVFSASSADSAVSVFLPIIREWSARTETGDRAELADLPEDVPVWNDVSATVETCLGAECPRYDDCFVTRMRQRAAASDVVIVNHHLLCADAAVRQSAYGEVIPACPNAIVDEAHQLEEVATQYFGYSVSNYRIEELARDVERLTAAGVTTDQGVKDDLVKAIECLRDSARAFFTELAFAHRSTDRIRGEERVRASASSLAQTSDSAAELTGALDALEGALARAGSVRLKADPTTVSPTTVSRGVRLQPDQNDDDASREAVAALIRRAGELREEIRLLLRASDADYVYFVEFRGRGIFLRAAPVDVSAIVRELLLDRMRTTILTSATLTVDGTFEYIRKRLGIRNAAEICLPSEFDFARQALMYLPPRMPDPRSLDFSMAAGREVVEILKRTRGRAFVLFTSYATMRDVLGIAEMALDYPIFAQGSAPRTERQAHRHHGHGQVHPRELRRGEPGEEERVARGLEQRVAGEDPEEGQERGSDARPLFRSNVGKGAQHSGRDPNDGRLHRARVSSQPGTGDPARHKPRNQRHGREPEARPPLPAAARHLHGGEIRPGGDRRAL